MSLTLIERECIMYYCSKGLTVTEIANILNRDKSTVSRELHRNSIGEEYLPKGKKMDSVTDEYINDFIDKLNKRPRKCLGWKTPYELHYNKVLYLT